MRVFRVNTDFNRAESLLQQSLKFPRVLGINLQSQANVNLSVYISKCGCYVVQELGDSKHSAMLIVPDCTPLGNST